MIEARKFIRPVVAVASLIMIGHCLTDLKQSIEVSDQAAEEAFPGVNTTAIEERIGADLRTINTELHQRFLYTESGHYRPSGNLDELKRRVNNNLDQDLEDLAPVVAKLSLRDSVSNKYFPFWRLIEGAAGALGLVVAGFVGINIDGREY